MRGGRRAVAVALSFGLTVSAAQLGVRDGKLAPCPNTPNCVSSQAGDAEHRVAPLTYRGTAAEARERLKRVIAAMPRTRLVTERDDYQHYTFISLVFRFVDDVEFWFDDAAKTIHVRSASRLGRRDFGVNRERVEAIRAAYD